MRTPYDVQRSLQRYMAQVLGPDWEVRSDREPGTVHFPYCRVQKVGPSGHHGTKWELRIQQDFDLQCYAGPAESVEEGQRRAADVEETLTLAFRRGASVAEPPTSLAATPSNSGGTLASGAHRYVVTGFSKIEGQTTPTDPAVSVSTSGAAGSVSLTWLGSKSLARYGVWRGALGAEQLIALTDAPAYVDNGSAIPNPAAILPVANTAKLGAALRVPLYDYSTVGADQPATDHDNRVNQADYFLVSGLTINQVLDPDDERRIAVTAHLRASWHRVGMVTPYTKIAAAVKSKGTAS